ncbi:L-histidine N(alpha)-methyltransferase [Angustibacter luteus]|uniref:Histidine N-alpha-methyltransferase n=1 Tax=Angustibacter luteus TaxID=658456 RepID=A0ABW1JKT1_9ACTN
MTITLTSHLAGTDRAQALADDVRAGLSATPKSLPPKWFYDERGSQLFDEITRLPEYYPTNAERAVLQERADEIVRLSGADTLVEIGSGTSEKTRLLLDAFAASGRLRRFVPFDVDPVVLRQAGAAVADEYPGTEVLAVAGDFERHLDRLPVTGRRLVAFLGSTIGNLEPAPRARFLATIGAGLRRGDAFLLGTDLVKDADRLVAAYDDDSGVTAAFNKNVLAVVNTELDADFDLDAFEHVARWDEHEEWIEMHLRSTRRQTVTVGALDLRVDFAAGELMRTEVSAKFRESGVRRELAAAGLAPLVWWTDPRGDFGVSLSTPR